MRLRFLQAVSSTVPGFPFQAGQIVYLPRLTPEFRQYLKDKIVQVLPDAPEAATMPRDERAVVPGVKK